MRAVTEPKSNVRDLHHADLYALSPGSATGVTTSALVRIDGDHVHQVSRQALVIEITSGNPSFESLCGILLSESMRRPNSGELLEPCDISRN